MGRWRRRRTADAPGAQAKARSRAGQGACSWGQGPAGEGLLEALRVSEPLSPVSIKRGGGKNRGED